MRYIKLVEVSKVTTWIEKSLKKSWQALSHTFSCKGES